jgi:dGTP triphosphohydrolase
MIELCKNGTNNNNTTNSHNKAFNLNFFLNETCKDAMNIMDFVDSIQLQLSDLENVGKVGYVEGISNIIVKNLKELDVEKRPAHCTDKKRETMYVKDENKWEKDEENNKIRKAIKRVVSKNQRLIPKFKEAHPDCNTYHSKFSDQYNKLILESCGGSGDNDLEKEEKIIKNISKIVLVQKDTSTL